MINFYVNGLVYQGRIILLSCELPNLSPICAVLITICFPYHLFTKNKIAYAKKIYTSADNELEYSKTYENGDVDWFKGFTAYREIMYDKNQILGGLLFIPGTFLFYKMGLLQNLLKIRPTVSK